MAMNDDIENTTNSVMLAIDKELRKADISAESHKHFHGFREIVKMQISMFYHERENSDEQT